MAKNKKKWIIFGVTGLALLSGAAAIGTYFAFANKSKDKDNNDNNIIDEERIDNSQFIQNGYSSLGVLSHKDIERKDRNVETEYYWTRALQMAEMFGVTKFYYPGWNRNYQVGDEKWSGNAEKIQRLLMVV